MLEVRPTRGFAEQRASRLRRRRRLSHGTRSNSGSNICDRRGRLITYWNQACVSFAGREPQLGQDRWCVTWRLFTIDGDPLPHEECPMAIAIREKKSIRTEIAIAMRPDGTA